MKQISILFLLFLTVNMTNGQSFIQVKNGQFIKEGKPYFYIGTNFWYGMNLASKGAGGDRERLIKELDHLQSIGVTNLRIMAASEGPDDEPWRMVPALQTSQGVYNKEVLDGLDFLIFEMGKRGMHAVVCLNNFWPWSGGMAQYVSWCKKDQAIPYPPPAENGNWKKYMRYTAQFYKSRQAKNDFKKHIQFIINRKNNYTNQWYKDDSTIMSWELANEPYGMNHPWRYRRWIKETAKFIKKLAPNQLVTTGSEGDTASPRTTKNNFRKDNKSKYIDYTTIHIWIQNWGWYDPLNHKESFPKALQKATDYINKHVKVAKQLNKPVVLEEFGISRDNNDHDPVASTQHRDLYFEKIFTIIEQHATQGSPLVGCNFWAWAGSGRPLSPKALWKSGDPFIGDPPHEHQGWYSIYDKDQSTIKIIQKYTDILNKLINNFK